jgi:hypothetical protein
VKSLDCKDVWKNPVKGSQGEAISCIGIHRHAINTVHEPVVAERTQMVALRHRMLLLSRLPIQMRRIRPKGMTGGNCILRIWLSVGLGLPLSGFLDKFASFSRLVCQNYVLISLLREEKIPSISLESKLTALMLGCLNDAVIIVADWNPKGAGLFLYVKEG